MPDHRPLNDLRARLAAALVLPHGHRDTGWAPPDKPMSAALRQTLHVFGSDREARPDNQAMLAAVRAFWRDPRAASFNQLKYVCYGLTVPVDADGRRLIDREPLFTRLLELVDERQGQAKPFRRCYQGLLAGYFGFEHRTENAGSAGANWLRLRGFLGDRLAAVQAASARMAEPPQWLTTLYEHRNLLADKPCARYARDLRRGDTRDLKALCAALGIEASSWVWHEAVLAFIVDLVEDRDLAFRTDLKKALNMVQSTDPELRIPDTVAKAAAAMLVMRYAQCADKPEQPQLRDTCIQRIGNPWLDRAAWDSAVRDEEARRMVESWLKRGLIKDFFELLSHDGAADQRRLNYWLKWEPQISDMWFALGGSTRRHGDPRLKELRGRMRGRERALTGGTTSNNAFIMQIGPLLAIEFGEKGNACFLMRFSDFKGDLVLTEQNIYRLKQRENSTKLRHDGQWELDFDGVLRKLIATGGVSRNVVPRAGIERAAAKETPTQEPFKFPTFRAVDVIPDLKRFKTRPELPIGWEKAIRDAARTDGLDIVDNRSKGGAFWVMSPSIDRASEVLQVLLDEYGFRYARARGFYLEWDQ